MEKKKYLHPLTTFRTVHTGIICGSDKIDHGDPDADTPPSPTDGVIGGDAKEDFFWDAEW